MNWIEGTDMRNMIKRTLAIVGVAVLAATTYAAVPNQINYQGRLTDNTPAQAPIDATVTMGFSIWDSATGGTSLWNETQSVSVANGLFNVLLGSSTPIPSTVFTSGATRYLEISVSGETLSPRQQIAAAPFASSAASADDAGTLGGVGAAGYQQRVASPCPAGYAINSIAADGRRRRLRARAILRCLHRPRWVVSPRQPARGNLRRPDRDVGYLQLEVVERSRRRERPDDRCWYDERSRRGERPQQLWRLRGRLLSESCEPRVRFRLLLGWNVPSGIRQL